METKEKTKIGKFLKKVGNTFEDAVGIGGVLLQGTPVGTALSIVDGFLEGKVNDPTLSEDKLAIALGLKDEFFKEKLEFEKELVALQQAEMESARKYNAQIQTDVDATLLAKYTPYLIDGFVSFIWGAITIYMIAKIIGISGTETVDWTVIMAVYVGVSDKFSTVLGFHRGSSMGSKLKDKR